MRSRNCRSARISAGQSATPCPWPCCARQSPPASPPGPSAPATRAPSRRNWRRLTGGGLGEEAGHERGNPKTEIRRPKEVRRSRRPKYITGRGTRLWSLQVRASDFLRASDFGLLRISGFELRVSSSCLVLHHPHVVGHQVEHVDPLLRIHRRIQPAQPAVFAPLTKVAFAFSGKISAPATTHSKTPSAE